MADFVSWHAVFILSAVLMLIISLTLYYLLPAKEPAEQKGKYFGLLKSMLMLYVKLPLVRRRALYQACLFGSFCLFWTASPLLLGGPVFGFSQTVIAFFALVGVSGAISAPFAGRAADRNWTRPTTCLALLGGSACFLVTLIFPLGTTASVVALVAGAILLDACVTANLVLGQREIFQLGSQYRSRLNALYIATIFVGGGIGSTLGAWAFARGGWHYAALAGAAMPALAFLFFLTERRSTSRK